MAMQHSLSQDRQALAAGRQEAAKLQKELTDLQVRGSRGRAQMYNNKRTYPCHKLANTCKLGKSAASILRCASVVPLQAVAAVAATQGAADRVSPLQHACRLS